MKIKLSFVTNSSSATFILSSSKRLFKTKIFNSRGMKYTQSFKDVKSVEALVKAVQYDNSYDFINEFIGPREYLLMPKPIYLICKKEITQNNRRITIVDINHHYIPDKYYKKISKYTDIRAGREHDSDWRWIEFFKRELFKPKVYDDIKVIFKRWE